MMIEIDEFGSFRDGQGRMFVRCKADPSSLFYIDVTSNFIEAKWRNVRYWIDLECYTLPSVIALAAKEYLIFKLESVSPQIFNGVHIGLKLLEEHWADPWVDFSSMSLGDLFNVVQGPVGAALEFRKFYKFCALRGTASADQIHAIELESVRINKRNPNSGILEWHETRGALTSSEIEIVRRAMMNRQQSEIISDTTSRLFAWVSFETLKRPIQLSEMLSDALWIPDPEAADLQYFLRIPKAKRQIGQMSELWPITAQLAEAIQAYSGLPSIKKMQEISGTLFVGACGGKSPNFGVTMKKWCNKLGLISPRTNELLVLTPYRIRHSGATQMAAQGASRDEIQYVLEHDSVAAADSYIDCLASEFCPLLERANRKLGGIFSDLNGLFFTGSIGNHGSGPPILIPVVQQPAIIGECGKSGLCGQHPFFSCYNGCRYFIAWRDSDHQKSLAYLESEVTRWGLAEGGKDRSKILKDLERVYQAVKDVVKRIEQGE